MAKLRGKAKEEFLKRMARGRKKAAAKNPKKRKPAKKKTAKKKTAAKRKAPKKHARPNTSHKTARKQSHRHTQKSRGSRNPKKKRRNSGIDEAAAMYEQFHGKPPGHIVEYDLPYHYPENFAELGKLKKLKIFLDSSNPDFPITDFGNCKVVCTPDGSNIYFVDGDQALNLENFDISSDKDDIDLGPCIYIMYHTTKGFHDFEPTDYYHHFGEEDGIYPRLNYNRLNKRLYLVGGNYRVRPEGIVN